MEKKDKVLTIDEAYDAVISYLEKYCAKTSMEGDVGDLVGEMYILQDGCSADPAALHDWNDSVNKILNQKPRVRPYLKFQPK